MKGGKELATDCLFLYIVFWSIFAGIAVDKLQLEYVGEKKQTTKRVSTEEKKCYCSGRIPQLNSSSILFCHGYL